MSDTSPKIDFALIDQLLIQVRARKEEMLSKYNQQIPKLQFVSTFQTVNFNFGRRMGHTTYIRQRANLEKDIIVSGLNNENFVRKYKNFRAVMNFCAGMEIENVWIDEPFMVFKTQEDIEDYYEFLYRKRIAGLVIMMGKMCQI